mgnify:CR=1 FL=1|tara:strand:+ start:301 stop:1050 length:750 start_codon:yes stop_codon:yes gene_type:complete
MAIDFGYGSGTGDEEFPPFFKMDAQVGVCKVRIAKDVEPQIPYPFRAAYDMKNMRMLHLCFPRDGGPQRLFFGDLVGPAEKPPPIGLLRNGEPNEFKVGFEVFMYVTDKLQEMGDKAVGIVPWCACSVGATMSFNVMHDIWVENDGEAKVDMLPIFVCQGKKTLNIGKGSTNILQYESDGWVERAKIPGFADALANRVGSNVAVPRGQGVDESSLQAQGSEDIFPAGDMAQDSPPLDVPPEPDDDSIPF